MSDHASKKTPRGTHSSPEASLEETERRTALRYPFTASAEVIELRSGTRLKARTSDMGLEGCYLDTLNTFPVGTPVRLRVFKGQHVFDAPARVSYCHPGLGMGVAFSDLTPEQGTLLVGWLTEQGAQLAPSAERPLPVKQMDQLARADGDLMVRLIHLLVYKGVLTEKEAAALLRDPLP